MAKKKNKRTTAKTKPVKVATRKRKPIPPVTQTEVLLANRHACCVCQKLRVQIHHIDGNPSNNAIENLAVLCMDHHDLASMQIGLTKKLQPHQVREYKQAWEGRCRKDLLALARDRVNFFVTLYKNPPRIREMFLAVPEEGRHRAVQILMRHIGAEEQQKSSEGGFQFNANPRANDHTRMCLASAAAGELYPSWLPRVPGHPEDPDLPVDLSPPHGMTAFHLFDLYFQILVRLLVVLRPPIPIERLLEFANLEELNHFAGSLISFRHRAYGKDVRSSRSYKSNPTSAVQLVLRKSRRKYRVDMSLRTMYVFSDTGAENLRKSRVCGVGIFGGATLERKGTAKEVHLRIIPLLIGMGGFGQSDASGWEWNLR